MFKHVVRKQEAENPKAKCVVVVYETPAIREHAARFCERLAQERESIAKAEMNWWSFRLLGHSIAGGDAAQKAALADVVIFAMNADGDLPEEIKLWIENWLNKRGEREGALVGLLAREERSHDVPPFREIYLRHIARRAGMDFLSHSAPTAARAIPDSLDSFSERAGQMTSVLDNILHTQLRNPPAL
jgi:hypothetical protein